MATHAAPRKNRTAIVTGSGRNIGRAVAMALAREGVNVVVNGHSNKAPVDKVVSEIRENGGHAIGIMADVAKHDEVAGMVAKAKWPEWWPRPPRHLVLSIS